MEYLIAYFQARDPPNSPNAQYDLWIADRDGSNAAVVPGPSAPVSARIRRMGSRESIRETDRGDLPEQPVGRGRGNGHGTQILVTAIRARVGPARHEDENPVAYRLRRPGLGSAVAAASAWTARARETRGWVDAAATPMCRPPPLAG